MREWLRWMAALVLGGTLGMCTPTAAANSPADSPTDSEIAVIPTSAVALSDDCARIAYIEQQFEPTVSLSPYDRIQGPKLEKPLGVSGKFRLAVANVSDPFALFTTAIDSELGNATGGKTPLARGAAGFGQRFGTSMAGAASGEFFSTFLFSSLFHQDPHYHRSPDAPTGKRIIRAFSYVVVTRSDSGKPMFNFAEFLGTTASSTVESAIHPEWEKGVDGTANRVSISIASDAAWNLMTEFLPDVARHINPKMLLLRRLADRASQQN